MDWSKRKGTTGKIEPSEQFLLEEKLTFHRRISSIIEEHDIPKEFILNIDQTTLSYVSLGKYTFNPKGAKTVPNKNVDKRQTTATFTVSMTGKVPPIQLIYEGKTRRCLPKFHFLSDFNVNFPDNHWSNTEKSIESFEKVIFPYLTQVKGSRKYLKEQLSLTIMNAFKGQDNAVILDLCQKHLCQAVIDPHNLTNRFQPLDITNKPSKYFISNKYNQWLSMQILQ